MSRSVHLTGAGGRHSAAGTVAFVLAALLAAPPDAAAQTCNPAPDSGTLPTVTYNGASYSAGISCTGMSGDLTLTITPPDGGTTFTGDENGIHVTNTNRRVGAISVDVGSGAKIGTQASPIGKSGINVEIQSSPTRANTAAITVNNAGSIRAKRSGIKVDRHSPGDVTVTNSGTIVTDHPDDGVKENGIIVRTRKKGHVVINHSGSVTSDHHAAIYAWYQGKTAENEGSIKITSSGSVRSMAKHGILAHVEKTAAAMPAIVTVTGGKVHGTDDGIRAANHGNGSSTVRVSGSAVIESDKEDGIHATTGKEAEGENAGNDKSEAAVTIVVGAEVSILTRNQGGEEDESSYGIHAEHFGNQAVAGAETDTGSISITSAGTIKTAGAKGHGIAAFATGTSATVPITVTVNGGPITATGNGIHVDNKGKGGVSVTVAHGAAVKSDKDGIYADGALLKDGIRAQTVTVKGTVTGGSGEYAGIHMVEGGTVVIGHKAVVSATSGTAIKANDEGDMVIVLEQDENSYVGLISGTIVNAETTSFKTRTNAGAEQTLSAGETVERRVEMAKSVYDAVHRLNLEKVEGGHEFKEDKDLRGRLYHPRARLYEALPSALLSLSARSGSGTFMQEDSGGWAKVFMSDGERKAKSSTTAAKGDNKHALVWDIKRQGLEAGYDLPADETLRIGFSAGYRTVKAAVMHGGDIKAKAVGGGVKLGWRPNSGVHVDGHLFYSSLSGIELRPMDAAAVINADGGNGITAGVTAGTEMDFQGMKLTPRAGFEWTSVSTGSFNEPNDLNGYGKVEGVSANSLKGTLGARIDMAAGESGTFWAAADLEHDFKDSTSITVPNDVLTAEIRSTWGRFGLGGEFMLSDIMTVSGSAYYAAAGGGNKDLGGSLALNVSF